MLAARAAGGTSRGGSLISEQPVREDLFYFTLRSPYFDRTVTEGALKFGVYNHMYMPFVYGNDPREEYAAITERVTLWDVGGERQCELRGPDAVRFADYLSPRDLSGLSLGDCKFSPVCDQRGEIMAECIVLCPWENVVWFSHSDVDLSLWAYGLALARGGDVRVEEADVAPMQLQGPLAKALLRSLVDVDLDALPRFRCVVTSIAGVDVVLSNTGWSKESGYEVYPLGTERAVDVWDAVREAGREHGLLVTGPNISRAVEQGILDTHYRRNSGMNPFEAGMGGLVDLDRGDFMGRSALLAVRERGPARKTVGLVSDRDPLPLFEDYWPLTLEDERQVGIVRWAVWSFALDRNIAIGLVEASVAEDVTLLLQTPTGPRSATVHPVPFVS
jgi:glycine cleavage system aminomethyltransferase T